MSCACMASLTAQLGVSRKFSVRASELPDPCPHEVLRSRLIKDDVYILRKRFRNMGYPDFAHAHSGGPTWTRGGTLLGVRRICGHNIRNNRAKHAQGIIWE